MPLERHGRRFVLIDQQLPHRVENRGDAGRRRAWTDPPPLLGVADLAAETAQGRKAKGFLVPATKASAAGQAYSGFRATDVVRTRPRAVLPRDPGPKCFRLD